MPSKRRFQIVSTAPSFLTAVLCVSLLAVPDAVRAQAATNGLEGYQSHAALVRALNRLSQTYPNIVAFSQIAQSPGGRAVHAVRLSSGGAADNRSALLIVANASGPHVVGTAVALAAIEHLASGYGSDSVITAILNNHVVYVIPRANPDAAEGLFNTPSVERIRNDQPWDDDRDQSDDEDGPEDLNGDGLITMIRVADPSGKWMRDPREPMLMRVADPEAGESGTHRLYVEGTDNDDDDEWNEDPLGGVDINRNFSFDYDFFGEATGLYQLAAPEARAVAEFFVDHPNIAVVYVLGPQDNLMTPWKHQQGSGIAGHPQGTTMGGPLRSILAGDEPYFGHVGQQFKQVTGRSGDPVAEGSGGDLLSFAYFDMGRWAFGSRVWWPPEMIDSTEKRDAFSPQRDLLRYLRQADSSAFVPWRVLRHPDFPNAQVEVGGFRPGASLNPPRSALDSVLAGQNRFITYLAGILPSVRFHNVRVEAAGDQVYRISAQLFNDGYLPTLAAIGERARWPRRIRLELRADQNQTVSGGRAVELIGAIPGSGGSIERSWVVVGPPGSRMTLRAVSPVAGEAVETVTLR
jgi:Zinc carboxypeptidase